MFREIVRHMARLLAHGAVAGLLQGGTALPWRPAAEGLQPRTTEATPARLQRTTARLRRWAFGPKTSWP